MKHLSDLRTGDMFRFYNDSSHQAYKVENKTDDTLHFWHNRTMKVIWFKEPLKDQTIVKV